MNKKSLGFNENYQKLKNISEELSQQSQGEPDIDGLLPKVEEATKAYRACKERLEAVKKALEEQLPDSNQNGIDLDERISDGSPDVESELTADDDFSDIPF
jgi:exodeoxyribonuclease VII small subunit